MPARERPPDPTRWVLLRGLSRSKEHWGDFPARLATAFPGAELATPDLPGCGALHAARSPAEVSGFLAAARAGLPPGPHWLLGLSLGGMVAWEWARCHRAEVAGLVVINTSIGGLSPPWQRLQPAAAAEVAAAMATVDPLARERRIYALTSNRPDGAEATAARWAELARRQPVRRSNVLRQMLAAARYRAPVPMPDPPPLLVLASRADRIVDAACSRSLAYRVPGARLIEHETAGHDLPLDEPDWVVGEIRRWVSDQAAEREAAAVTGTKLLQI